MSIKGIDVSHYQGNINWPKVKEDGIEFAIIRCGWGQDYASQDDKTFNTNAVACEQLGMPYGVYLFSYANTVGKAESEARHVLRMINGLHPVSVWYDLEDANTTGKCSKAVIGEMAKKFFDTISAERPDVTLGTYANLNWWNNYLTAAVFDSYQKWVAQYYSKCTYKKAYAGWQYTSSGSVSGITGRVDMNEWYIPFGNSYVPASDTQKSNEDVAREVMDGAWGNGITRYLKLTAAGYNYKAVQSIVDKLVEESKEQWYVVKKGDTLSKIAKKYNTTVLTIKALNPAIRDVNLIYVNQNIRVK